MKCLPAIVLAIILVAAEGKIVPASDVENQQTSTQPVSLSDYIKEAQNRINDFGIQLQQQFNLPNQEDIVNTLREHSANFTSSVQEYIKTVTDEVKAKNPELENLWTNMTTKLSEMIDNLNTNSETKEQISQLRAKFQEGVQTLVTESENAAKTISENSNKVQEGIAKLTKQAIDIAVQASQNLNNQLQQATTPQP
ncbi:uncharacterized protein LOC105423558 [Pogonomyrmex barbatus]|uniref:Uncharacterized protein LOC105423558 n=1 Tax=Pogonomyrmex barbatus TaxID=144034 RepID=A0A6I9WIU2_9HYME|nr:uncharacterized protein LOC105423558 [Pogonomyrmex barbatus]